MQCSTVVCFWVKSSPEAVGRLLCNAEAANLFTSPLNLSFLATKSVSLFTCAPAIEFKAADTLRLCGFSKLLSYQIYESTHGQDNFHSALIGLAGFRATLLTQEVHCCLDKEISQGPKFEHACNDMCNIMMCVPRQLQPYCLAWQLQPGPQQPGEMPESK